MADQDTSKEDQNVCNKRMHSENTGICIECSDYKSHSTEYCKKTGIKVCRERFASMRISPDGQKKEREK